MDIRQITAPAVQQHNAQTAREEQIVIEIDRLLRLHRFPSEKVWVDVRFDYGMAEHSASKLSVMSVNGELHGTVEIRLQGLFLWQDFDTFYQEVIPHELAHVFMDLRHAEHGTAVGKPHDEDWMDAVLEINPDIEPAAKVKGEFDDRPIKLQRGAIGCGCDCGDLDSFATFPNTPATVTKLHNEELICSQCSSAYKRLKREEWPAEIRSMTTFHDSLLEMKIHHAPISR